MQLTRVGVEVRALAELLRLSASFCKVGVVVPMYYRRLA